MPPAASSTATPGGRSEPSARPWQRLDPAAAVPGHPLGAKVPASVRSGALAHDPRAHSLRGTQQAPRESWPTGSWNARRQTRRTSGLWWTRKQRNVWGREAHSPGDIHPVLTCLESSNGNLLNVISLSEWNQSPHKKNSLTKPGVPSSFPKVCVPTHTPSAAGPDRLLEKLEVQQGLLIVCLFYRNGSAG